MSLYKMGISDKTTNAMQNSDPEVQQMLLDSQQNNEIPSPSNNRMLDYIKELFGFGAAQSSEMPQVPNLTYRDVNLPFDSKITGVTNTTSAAPFLKSMAEIDASGNVNTDLVNKLIAENQIRLQNINPFLYVPRGIETISPGTIVPQVLEPGGKFGTSVDNFQGFTDKEDFSKPKKSRGIKDLFRAIGNFIPGFNFLRNFEGKSYDQFSPGSSVKGGIYTIGDFSQPAGMVNDFYDPVTQTNRFDRAEKRFQETGSMKDLFAASRTGAEFFRRRREIRDANQKALIDAAKKKRSFNTTTNTGSNQNNNEPSFTGTGDFATFDTSGKDYGPFSR